MKFRDVKKEEWNELKPYLDTCLLPFTGLSGKEEPWEVTNQLEQLQHVLDLVEIPFKGRTVTYPAIQYALDDEKTIAPYIKDVAANIKISGFSHVVLVCVQPIKADVLPDNIDLMIHKDMNKQMIQDKIMELWRK